MKVYYVYILSRPNNVPFYVRKGSGKRIKGHEREARSGHFCHKCNIIRKVWANGQQIIRTIVFKTADESEAFEKEKQFIALIGRKNLANMTDGGEGASGFKNSEQQRKNKSVIAKKRLENPDARAALVSRLVEGANTPEARKKLSIAVKVWLATPEGKAHTRKLNDAKWSNPESFVKLAQWNKERWSDPKEKEKLSERNKSVEARAKLSATRKAQWADPEYRAKMILARWKKVSP